MVPVGDILYYIVFVLTMVLFFIMIGKLAEIENRIKWVEIYLNDLEIRFDKILQMINNKRSIE